MPDLKTTIRHALSARQRRGPGTLTGLDLRPSSAYEAQTRQMVEDLKADLAELRLRINGLLFLVAGAVVVDIVIRLTK